MVQKFESKISSAVLSNKFEIFLGLLTLSSVALALVFYIPEIELSTDQEYAIYVFDLFVVGILVFDFYIIAKHSKPLGIPLGIFTKFLP